MDALIEAAAHALARGDPLAALKCVALRDDPSALAIRGIALAQLGELVRARELLRQAARAFGSEEPLARARCMLAMVEIALALRELGEPMRDLTTARAALEAHGDLANAAHAGYLEARRLLLIGRLDAAESVLVNVNVDMLTLASRTGYWLVAAGIAMRRIRARDAKVALTAAEQTARAANIPTLSEEVSKATLTFAAPAARVVTSGSERMLSLAEVEALIASDTLIVDASRNQLRHGVAIVPLGRRPVLFALLRLLAEAWPADVTRADLLARAFRVRQADESHRVRLRVELARLRAAIDGLAHIQATEDGFILEPIGVTAVVVLLPPQEHEHADVLALLADGEAWSSSALALALDVSPRTVQRALEALAANGKVDGFGRGRASRWLAKQVPGFPTNLLLPVTPAPM